jgi:hypothetical protein
MKKLLFLVLLLIPLTLYAQKRGAKYCTFNLDADTMTIEMDDAVMAVCVSVPDWATDSTDVIGDTRTLDDIVTDTIKIAPGEQLSIGFESEVPVNYLKIMPADKCRVVVLVPYRK